MKLNKSTAKFIKSSLSFQVRSISHAPPHGLASVFSQGRACAVYVERTPKVKLQEDRIFIALLFS